jgi:hypothetical protein
MSRSDYAARGLIKQQQTLPGTEAVNPPPKLRRWEDLTPEHRSGVEEHLSSTYGITMRNAVHNHGILIDRAVSRPNGQAEAGRNFYRGGSDEPESRAGRAGVEEISQRHGVSFPKAAYLRAALSPRSNVHDEVTNAHTLTGWFNDRRGKRKQGTPPPISGLAATQNTNKAVRVLGHEGDPSETRGEDGKQQFGTPTTAKISSYAQSYTHPDHPDTRTAVDTHAVGGMAPHLPKQAPTKETGKFDSRGRPFKKPVSQSHPEWRPNQEDVLNRSGTYEFFDYAQRKAAEKRGLSATEGQSLAWHAERSSRTEQPGTGKGRTGKGKNVPEEKPHVHPGQRTLF